MLRRREWGCYEAWHKEEIHLRKDEFRYELKFGVSFLVDTELEEWQAGLEELRKVLRELLKSDQVISICIQPRK
ncbi:hypothetical protein EVAR_4619_1 [Eumeta japonica]|uniref:Uncharacterized protein n=1 Tax=Eumeta variegata TaxID=151549 RepID=A0A4C1SX10_EUMVA|nr:hypothetical protein EVAR_4619_1 [Eumeta japonica]